MSYTDIIWDWNGTLVDDVAVSVDCVNDIFTLYNMPHTTIEEYLSVITPSLEEYYGRYFDMSRHTMTELLSLFQKYYKQRANQLVLMNGAADALRLLKESGKRQYIVSSFEQSALNDSVKMLGVRDYFDIISGCDDIHCGSKSERARKIVQNSEKAVLIGDSVCDYITATEAGCDCILIASGHQQKSDLLKCKPKSGTVAVFDRISDAVKVLL
ncbi:MAG: HAD family hydrolase [Acutalibacteraceae bacterium]|nr:HAD family hydrolase [Acutalibacteraceae bacterium]